MKNFLSNKAILLFVILTGFFVTNALVAEFIGVKIFALEPTLGFPPLEWNLFGQSGSLMLTAGVLLWPVVFVMTDLINEYYGKKAVRILSWMTAGLITYAFAMVFGTIRLVPAGWWVTTFAEKGVPDMQAAFSQIFGQGMWIIMGSLVAFLLGQLIDAVSFHKMRVLTGDKHLWLRATGSTLISQFIDSFVVLYIAFVLGPQKWSISLFLAIGIVNYAYKFIVAIVLTPAIYGAHYLIDIYLGKPLSRKLRAEARGEVHID